MTTLSEFNVNLLPAPKLCKTCFMTGKACIYQRPIQEILHSSRKGRGFMVMPFRSTLDEVYRAQIEPCLKSVVEKVDRADDVTKTGYVICERICRQIQQSHLVSAELSADNPNVFYELGLAYALERKIAIFIQESVANKREAVRKALGLGNKFNLYNPFSHLNKEEIKMWSTASDTKDESGGDGVFILLADSTQFSESVNGQELTYTIDGLCRGAIHRALDSLFSSDIFPKRPERVTMTVREGHYQENREERTFESVEQKIRNSSCVIICMSVNEPISYFWLGFAHGLEKDAVPITVLGPSAESGIKGLEERTDSMSDIAGDVPFDMRALWHIRFPCSRPSELEKEIRTILGIIFTKDRGIYWRKRFWSPFLEDGKVSVFVGAVELTKNKRHVVGEWDYRTVSELTSFLASAKETMETVIQTPTFQASTAVAGNQAVKNSYIKTLSDELAKGNSVLIASADVNDMTEVALATFARVEPFNPKESQHPGFSGIVAFKQIGSESMVPSVYFQADSGMDGQRGFWDIQGGKAHTDRTYATRHQTYDEGNPSKYTHYFGHIARMRLPEGRWSLVLQGITGPATLGILQVISGCFHKQFSLFADGVDPSTRAQVLAEISKESETLKEAFKRSYDTISYNKDIKQEAVAPTYEDLVVHSEALTKRIVEYCDHNKKSSVEVLVKVYLVDGQDQHHDERKIAWWDFVFDPRDIPVPNLLARRNSRVGGKNNDDNI